MATRMKHGKKQALFGGYVSWDGRRRDSEGNPIRERREVRVWLRADLQEDDCGSDTNELVAAIISKFVQGKPEGYKEKRNVECRECWRY